MPIKNPRDSWTNDQKRPRTASKTAQALFVPAQAERHMVELMVNVDSYTAWAHAQTWKAVSSTCKADARSRSTVSLPVLSVQIFVAMIKKLPALPLWGFWLTEEDGRISHQTTAGVSTWRVGLTDLEELTRIFNFSSAKADSSVSTARASK